MKRTPIIVVAAVLLAAVAGCTPDAQETPTPEPVVSAPTPAPTPEWTEEEQAAIDAVQHYLAVWTYISQNLQTADWNAIRDVASDPAANDAGTLWVQWNDNGWHLVGEPIFTPDDVSLGGLDYVGQRYHVHGCYSIEESYLADSNGDEVGQKGEPRSVALYQVMKNPDGRYYVFEDDGEDTPC